MLASQSYDGDSLPRAAAGRRGRHSGLMAAWATLVANVSSVADDFLILAQFAFGRDYVTLAHQRKRL